MGWLSSVASLVALASLAALPVPAVSAISPEESCPECYDAIDGLLIRATYRNLVVEVGYIEGSQPGQAALERFRTDLSYVVDKDAIRVSGPSPVAWDGGMLTETSALDLAETKRTTKPGGAEASLFVLYVPPNLLQDSNTLGFTIPCMVVTGTNTCGIPAHPTTVVVVKSTGWSIAGERDILMHEFGHLIGLVESIEAPASGCPSHEDPAYPNHSINKNSLMYHEGDPAAAAETDFDSNDTCDIETLKDYLYDRAAKREQARQAVSNLVLAVELAVAAAVAALVAAGVVLLHVRRKKAREAARQQAALTWQTYPTGGDASLAPTNSPEHVGAAWLASPGSPHTGQQAGPPGHDGSLDWLAQAPSGGQPGRAPSYPKR